MGTEVLAMAGTAISSASTRSSTRHPGAVKAVANIAEGAASPLKFGREGKPELRLKGSDPIITIIQWRLERMSGEWLATAGSCRSGSGEDCRCADPTVPL